MIPHAATQALECLQQRLESSLLAVYLHGSAVSGGLCPHSDIDLLAIIQQPLTIDNRQALVHDLLAISGHYPNDPKGRRPLEIIIFNHADLLSSAYPARCELMYGEWLRQGYAQGHIPGQVCDPDLTLVLANARDQAMALLGPRAQDLLPHIPTANIHQAIHDAMPALVETLPGDERNVLLTLARMWYTIETGRFTSKPQASEWAAARLPTEQADILGHACQAYLQGSDEDWQHRLSTLLLTIQNLSEHIMAKHSSHSERPMTGFSAVQAYNAS